MNKKLLLLLFVPFLLIGCNGGGAEIDTESHETHTIEHPKHTGEIGDFALTGPGNGFVTDKGFTLLGKKRAIRIIINSKLLAP